MCLSFLHGNGIVVSLNNAAVNIAEMITARTMITIVVTLMIYLIYASTIGFGHRMLFWFII